MKFLLNTKMKHLDLFSGLGGFAVAAKKVWGAEYECAGFCEIDNFCQELLRLRFPNTKIYGDIRELTKERLIADSDSSGSLERGDEINSAERNKTLPRSAERPEYRIDLLTGGFPCQPFSGAGLRKGAEDSRHLWPEMYRIIKECRPHWILGENVRGILSIGGGVVFEQVCLDLEAIGYQVQPFIIPACAVNAPHRRDRVWIVAHSEGFGNGGSTCEKCGVQERIMVKNEPERGQIRSESERCASNAADTLGVGRQRTQQKGNRGRESEKEAGNGNCPITDTCNQRLQWNEQSGTSGEGARPSRPIAERSWNEDWTEVAAELCGMDDGAPVELDKFKLSKSRHRVERLKALGNAIVWQVAFEIMKTMK